MPGGIRRGQPPVVHAPRTFSHRSAAQPLAQIVDRAKAEQSRNARQDVLVVDNDVGRHGQEQRMVQQPRRTVAW